MNPTTETPDAFNATPRVRFAPSPTGEPHLGAVRTALFNWLYARHHGGVYVLRIEDTDAERSRADVLERMLEALRWLGLDWDEGPETGGSYGPYLQSERSHLYREHAEKLREAGLAYDCYMTPEELESRRQTAIAESRPFRYEGWHRDLSEADAARFRAEGRAPCLRLRVDPPAEGYTVEDLVRGPTHFPADQIHDFVLLRSDGTPSYHMANVIDDHLMRITHVIRGEDHLTNTIRHLALFAALGWEPPRYAHLPIILGEDRSKLSKRHGAVSVLEYKAAGYLPEALVNELALLGWSSPDGEERFTLGELVERFDLDRVGKSGSIFDAAKLRHFNGLLIREMPIEDLERRLGPFMAGAPAIPEGKTRELIELVREELHVLGDFAGAAERVLGEPDPAAETLADAAMAEAPRVLEKIAEVFAADGLQWERSEIKKAIREAGKVIGVKGKGLFFPIRVALSGSPHGPALDGVVALLGRAVCLARIEAMREKLAAGA